LGTVLVKGTAAGASIPGAILVLVFTAMCVVFVAEFGVQFSRVDGYSMEPTLENRDVLLVNRMAYEIGEPQPGDIVTLYYPMDPNQAFVKRVIAGQEAKVQILDGYVYIDDKPLQDDCVASAYRGHENWGPELVSDGYYFVMGDHRNRSSDSRDWGFVPRRYITGKVTLRWWPLQRMTIFSQPCARPPAVPSTASCHCQLN
jgi:signal peptidase I